MFPAFSGGLKGGQASLYLQDHFSPFRNLWVDLGVRYDYFDLVTTAAQTSPRIGFAYHFNRTKSVLHAAYNRYFSPPPIEYSLLASFIGNNAVDPDQRVGNVRAYRQNYYGSRMVAGTASARKSRTERLPAHRARLVSRTTKSPSAAFSFLSTSTRPAPAAPNWC